MPIHYQPDSTGSTRRPQAIAVLGIMSFINSGAFVLFYALAWLVMGGVGNMPYDEFAARTEEALAPFRSGMSEEDMVRFDAILPLMHSSGTLLFGLLFLRTLVRLMGTVGIWRAKRSGFHVYAAAQIVGIFLPLVVLPWSAIGVFGPLMALGTTAVFGRHLNRLN